MVDWAGNQLNMGVGLIVWLFQKHPERNVNLIVHLVCWSFYKSMITWQKNNKSRNLQIYCEKKVKNTHQRILNSEEILIS